MKKLSKICILSLILIVLCISCVNASELDSGNVQISDESNLQEISIDEDYLIEEDPSSTLDSNQISDEVQISAGENNQNNDYDINNEIDELIAENDNNENCGTNILSASSGKNLLSASSGNDILSDFTGNDILSASSGNVHKVSPSNYTKYFNNKGYVNTTIVKSGDTIDLSGNFNKRNFTFTIPCSITSSQKNAYLTNCVVQYLDVNSSTYSDVSNLKFTVNIEKHPSV